MEVYVFLVFFCGCSSVFGADVHQEWTKPNIIIILADDLGWNDVGFHNATLFQTPNIDALAYNGVILNNFHAPSLCTPSRSSLLTGKFPIFTGMQHSVILEAEPWGLPLHLRTLPQFLKPAGYATHLVGKWHQGFFSKQYTPTYRGFDSFFGYYQGHADYFTHTSKETFGNESEKFMGYDLHDGLSKYQDDYNVYGTDLYTAAATNIIQSHNKDTPLFLMLSQIATHSGEESDRLQAPPDEIAKFDYIEDEEKRIFAAMVSKLDQSVGNVVKALHDKNMLENSIVMFMSDNGAPSVGTYATTGSNYPFRGIKSTEFEGGTRLPAVMWSPLLDNKQRVSNILMHMVDVLPTLCTAVGIDPYESGKIDGISMWDSLQRGDDISPRTEFPYNIDPADPENATGAVRVGDWKYYQGTAANTGDKFSWIGDQYSNSFPEVNPQYYENIEQSLVNKAITNLYIRTSHIYPNDVISAEPTLSTPLTKERMEELRNQARVTCNNDLDSLPICDPTTPCLFNLNEDPCERYNMAQRNPEVYRRMIAKFEDYRSKVVPPLNKPRDECADPAKWDGEWVNWYDFEEMLEHVSVQGNVLNWFTIGVSVLLLSGVLALTAAFFKSLTKRYDYENLDKKKADNP